MRNFLPFLILKKEIEELLKLPQETPKDICSPFKNTLMVHKDNQGVISLAVAPQM